MKVIFVDRLCLSSFFRIMMTFRSCESVYHFEHVSRPFGLLLSILLRLGFMRCGVEKIDNHVGQIKDESGESQYIRLLANARSIASTICKDEVRGNALVEAMGPLWASDKVAWYFEKEIEHRIRTEFLRIGLVQWLLQDQIAERPGEALILIERNPWFSLIEEHACLHGVRLIAYKRLWDASWILDACSRLIKALRRLSCTFWAMARNRMWRPMPLSSVRNENSLGSAKEACESRLAIHYWFRSLGFDSTERSEFFWLKRSQIPTSEILVYGYVANKPLDKETADELNRKGIKILGRAPGVSMWIPTRRMLITLFRVLVKLTVGTFGCMRKGHRVPLFYLRALGGLAWEYAYWYDFFEANRVRVNVGTLNTNVAQVLALDALNGVSLTYQYSVSPILFPSSLLSNGEDVQFIFSPVFEQLWRSMNPPVRKYVSTGFIYDDSIQEVRKLPRVQELRRDLESKGAKFILAFFDENTVNRWDIYASDDASTDEYEFLLQWLLDDRTLGIVFKPKKSTNLFERIARVLPLIEKARETGRCKFLMTDTLVGHTFPAEAALAADVCIGKLDGGTAAFEARLAGVPSILIDTEGFRSHQFYGWGKDRVVFEDWKSLRKAVERYRRMPEGYPEFGDWSPALDELDPYRDEQASLRMGLFISWVYEAVKQGMDKNDAIALTSQRLEERWGLAKDGAKLHGKGAGSAVR